MLFSGIIAAGAIPGMRPGNLGKISILWRLDVVVTTLPLLPGVCQVSQDIVL